jgi:hypothetical protein
MKGAIVEFCHTLKGGKTRQSLGRGRAGAGSRVKIRNSNILRALPGLRKDRRVGSRSLKAGSR